MYRLDASHATRSGTESAQSRKGIASIACAGFMFLTASVNVRRPSRSARWLERMDEYRSKGEPWYRSHTTCDAVCISLNDSGLMPDLMLGRRSRMSNSGIRDQVPPATFFAMAR